MQPPTVPQDETTRLAALQALGLLDTGREERFDRITRMAARVFDVPIALISLLDAHRQWFKSNLGFPQPETPRATSFCNHAIQSPEALVVPDATLDGRFAGSPMVTAPPHVRFYAGQPIRARDGSRVGVLCVLDVRARRFSGPDVHALRDLAAWAEVELQRPPASPAGEPQVRGWPMLDLLPDPIFIVDEQDRIEHANPAATRTFADGIPTLAGQRIQLVLPELQREGVSAGVESVGRRRDGTQLPVELTVREAACGDGRRWLVLARDLGSQRAAELALRTSEARLRAVVEEQRMLLEHTRDFVYRHDTQGVFTYLSPAVESVTGHTAQDWLAHYTQYLTDHPENANVVAYTEETLRTGVQSPSYPVEIWHRKGHRVVLEVSERAYYENGKIAGIIGVARDVTERRRADEALRASEQRYADLVRESADPILSLAPDGRITSFNPAAERISGHLASELLGRPLVDAGILTAAAAARATEEARRALDGEERPPFELEWMTRDGNVLILEAIFRPIHHGAERVGLQVALRDVTERKRVDRMKDEFISTVSHELRTPLTSILGSLGLVSGGVAGALPPPVKRLIEMALRNGERLLRLVNDILDLEKIKSGLLTFQLRPVELRPLIEQAIDTDRVIAARFGVHLEIAAAPPNHRVLADPDRLVQVFTNLLANAVKFSPENGRVTISIDEHEGRARLSIRDRGPGIPAEFRARIFQKYAQAEGPGERSRGGTGLGLSIAKAIVERMNGRISYEAAPGGGTVFSVELPMAEPRHQVRGNSSASSTETSPSKET